MGGAENHPKFKKKETLKKIISGRIKKRRTIEYDF